MKGVIITVNYNNYDVTLKFVNSLRKLDLFTYIRIVIVDNSVNEEDCLVLNKYVDDNSLNNISILKSEINRGYFGAVSYAVSELNLNLVDNDFCIISNNDIIINDVEFFSKTMQNIGIADIIAPSVISLLSGKDQNPYRENEITKLQKLAIRVYFVNYIIGYASLLFWLFFKFIKGNANLSEIHEHNIYSGHGSFIILSAEYFRKGGYIDDRLFLYGEEEFITSISKRFCMNIRYLPDLKVYHDEHKTTDSKNLTRKIYKYQKEAYKFIKKEYRGIY
jgi:GT2 family glycosyltransferase